MRNLNDVTRCRNDKTTMYTSIDHVKWYALYIGMFIHIYLPSWYPLLLKFTMSRNKKYTLVQKICTNFEILHAFRGWISSKRGSFSKVQFPGIPISSHLPRHTIGFYLNSSFQRGKPVFSGSKDYYSLTWHFECGRLLFALVWPFSHWES